MTTRTAMNYAPYYDEDGEYHRHDRNISTTRYTCSEGHAWRVQSARRCPALECDWHIEGSMEITKGEPDDAT